MTPGEAAVLHARESADYGLVVWFVTLSDPKHPGQVVAYAKKGDHSGGHRLPGELVADTLEQLRPMLPPGLTRRDRTPFERPETVESWD